MKRSGITSLALGLILLSAQAFSEPKPDTQQMQLESEVKGQRSQPKVLFILPWQDTVQTDAIQIGEAFVTDEDFLEPIERGVFQEEIKLYKQLETTP